MASSISNIELFKHAVQKLQKAKNSLWRTSQIALKMCKVLPRYLKKSNNKWIHKIAMHTLKIGNPC